MNVDNLARDDRAYAEFWNIAHSIDSIVNGWVLALWTRNPPSASLLPDRRHGTPEGQQIVAIGWPPAARRRKNYVTMPLGSFLDQPELMNDDDVVVLASRTLPESVMRLLSRKLGYEPGLDGQREGWWFTDNESIPPHLPASHPSGALLMEKPDEMLVPGKALVLVDVDDYWVVLSERGARTYVSGSRLIELEPMLFCTSDRGKMVVWTAVLDELIPYDEVIRRFGKQAGERSRKDARSIVVRISVVPDNR